MADPKSTKLSIREDRPTAISSSAHGSNVDALGFNITFLAARNPKLAVELIKLYAQAQQVKENDPIAPDEDFELFAGEVFKSMPDSSDE